MSSTKPLIIHNFSGLTGQPGDFVDLAAYQAAQEEIEVLKVKVAKYENALKFYSSNNKGYGPDFITVALQEIIIDNGKIARQALGEK